MVQISLRSLGRSHVGKCKFAEETLEDATRNVDLKRLKIRKLRESALSLLSLINRRVEVDELKVGVINPDSSGLKLHGTRTE